MKRILNFLKNVVLVSILLVTWNCRNEPKTMKTENLHFSGYDWWIKSSQTPVGPGPNHFSGSSNNVWLDETGQLHMKITNRDDKWYCAEVVSLQNFGYGKYVIRLASRFEVLNENVVVGLFTWSDTPNYHHREIDIELSRWGDPVNANSQYVVQPWDTPGNIHRFEVQLSDRFSTHIFDWRSDQITWQTYAGISPLPIADSLLVQTWSYRGADIPKPGDENFRINFWLMEGRPPTNNKEAEVVVNQVEFIP